MENRVVAEWYTACPLKGGEGGGGRSLGSIGIALATVSVATRTEFSVPWSSRSVRAGVRALCVVLCCVVLCCVCVCLSVCVCVCVRACVRACV